MFGDVDKKLMKYFKRKKESPFSILMKLMKTENRRETQEMIDKENKYKDDN